MRPGRPEDLPQIVELGSADVAACRHDIPPNEERLKRVLARYDWEAQSRVVERGGRITGSVMVICRPSPDGVIASLHVSGEPDDFVRMADWRVVFSRAVDASVAQLFVGSGRLAGLERTGLKPVRSWLRMDRGLSELPAAAAVAGFELADATTMPGSSWVDVFNRAFADHWRFAPPGEGEVIGGRAADLCLMAITAEDRAPAAIAVGDVEDFGGDPRPQPVGLVSSVGTVAEHRRKGVATWLVVEILRRLRDAGARSASLYVDGSSAVKAFELYEKIGFEVASESEVWEATFP